MKPPDPDRPVLRHNRAIYDALAAEAGDGRHRDGCPDADAAPWLGNQLRPPTGGVAGLFGDLAVTAMVWGFLAVVELIDRVRGAKP